MAWFRSPPKLFGYTGLLLFLVRMFFPPPDQAPQLHSYVHFFDLRLDLTGYGVFEFAALVFAISALTYYLIFRLTNRYPNGSLVQLHFWPSLLFALASVFLAHWISSIPSSQVNNPDTLASLNRWCYAFTWAFVVFLVLQVALAFAAARTVWRSRKKDTYQSQSQGTKSPS